MTCARCGCGVYRAEDQIVMTKVWHKCCFRCCNCNIVLNKDTAKLFQGEIFCEQCHCTIIDGLKPFSTSPEPKPARVCSSPSCIYTDEDNNHPKRVPTINYCNKYDIRLPKEKSSTKVIKSCSCIPDAQAGTSYCFSIPIPREVANYYNRIMRKKSVRRCPKNLEAEDRCFSSSAKVDVCPRITIRSISPPNDYCSTCSCGRSLQTHSPLTKEECCCNKNRNHFSPRRTRSPSKREPRCFCRCHEDHPRYTGRPIRVLPCNVDLIEPKRNRECSKCREVHKRPKCRTACYVDCPVHRERNNMKRYSFREQSNGIKSCGDDENNDPCPYRSKSIKSFDDDRRRVCTSSSIKSFDNIQYDHPQRDNRQDYRKGNCCKYDLRDNEKYSNNTSDCSRNNYEQDYRQEKYEKSIKNAKYCICGKLNPCACKLSKIRAECTSLCVRCKQKVYAAEKIAISSGSFHTNCFCCYCCHKPLDVKTVFENKGEIYCRNCYNCFTGNQYYGYGASQYC